MEEEVLQKIKENLSSAHFLYTSDPIVQQKLMELVRCCFFLNGNGPITTNGIEFLLEYIVDIFEKGNNSIDCAKALEYEVIQKKICILSTEVFDYERNYSTIVSEQKIVLDLNQIVGEIGKIEDLKMRATFLDHIRAIKMSSVTLFGLSGLEI